MNLSSNPRIDVESIPLLLKRPAVYKFIPEIGDIFIVGVDSINDHSASPTIQGRFWISKAGCKFYHSSCYYGLYVTSKDTITLPDFYDILQMPTTYINFDRKIFDEYELSILLN